MLLTSNIVINEIHYDPPDKTESSEYIELYNNSDKEAELSGWQFADAIRYEIPAGTVLAPREYVLISQDPETVQRVFGVDSLGPWEGKLKNGTKPENLRVLLAEDSLVAQRVVSRLMQKLGHEVHQVSDGKQLLEATSSEQFDLIIMDVEMPKINGLDAARQIRASEGNASRQTPIIALTAHSTNEDRKRCLEAGMDGYITKPISADSLKAELERVWAICAEFAAT